MKVTVNGVEITLTPEQEALVVGDSMKVIYDFHNTTAEAFDKLYENIPAHIKAYAQETMIVNYYNDGKQVDFSDDSYDKYYPYFDYEDGFSLSSVCYYFDYSFSHVPPPCCFFSEESCNKAVEKYMHIYKISRGCL